MNSMGEFSITLVIIIVTCIVSYRALQKQDVKLKLLHSPYAEKRNKEWYRMVSSGFIHGDFMHLAFNMYVLFGFGVTVEKYFSQLYSPTYGRLIYVLFYLLAIVAADLSSYFKHKDNPQFASLGASGAVSAVLFIFIAINPWSSLNLMFVPIPIPAIVVGIGYLIYSTWAAKKENTKVNHLAHFWGAIFGVVFLWITRPDMVLYFFQQLMSPSF